VEFIDLTVINIIGIGNRFPVPVETDLLELRVVLKNILKVKI